MHYKTRFPIHAAILMLSLLLAACKTDCPDCTNPACDNYDPCCVNDCTDDDGKVLYEKISSSALESNLVHEKTERKVSVYLPPGYEKEESRSYPVLYLLHGFTGDHTTWYGGTASELYGEEGQEGMYLDNIINELISNEIIEPMIVVCADNYNSYEGSWYTNSTVTGNWEDFMVYELVPHIDSRFRTLAVPDSRGIAGHSMGAEGAMRLAMKHPDVYGLVYAMSGALEYAKTYLELSREDIIAANQVDAWNMFLHPYVKSKLSRAVAYAPNPNLSPIPGELPLDENGSLIDSTWQKWLKHDPYSMLDAYSENLKILKAIMFDSGTSDNTHFGCDNFSKALALLNIDHMFESYSGDHLNKIPERLATKVLPFFSENMSH